MTTPSAAGGGGMALRKGESGADYHRRMASACEERAQKHVASMVPGLSPWRSSVLNGKANRELADAELHHLLAREADKGHVERLRGVAHVLVLR